MDKKIAMRRHAVPTSSTRVLHFRNGVAIGTSDKWAYGEYCKILTTAGMVGCAIFDIDVADEFGDAIAIAKGTPVSLLVEPEQLLEAIITGVSRKAAELGVKRGMTGREAVETFLAIQPVLDGVK
jgi:uncharacterized protein YunC (DUF1805 family)